MSQQQANAVRAIARTINALHPKKGDQIFGNLGGYRTVATILLMAATTLEKHAAAEPVSAPKVHEDQGRT